MRFHKTAAFAAAAVLVVSACGDDSEAGSTEDPRRIEINLTDFEFNPDLAAVVAGQTVEFVVTNNGAEEHEFRVTNQAEIDAHIEGGHEEHMGDDDDMGDGYDMGDDMGLMLVLAPGETKSLTVAFPSDATTLTHFVCLIPGHYEAGMVGTIVYSG